MKDVFESYEGLQKIFFFIIDVDMCIKFELLGYFQILVSLINNFILMDSFIFVFMFYDIEEYFILFENFKGLKIL